MSSLKCVIVGDGGVGKTWLITTFITNESPQAYLPTVFDNFTATIQYKNKRHVLSLWDTSGQEEYSQLRALSYPQTDVFILCYAVNNVVSFNNIKAKWYCELKQFNKPILLVATKVDTRTNNTNNDMVTPEKGIDLQKKLHINDFIECSALKKTKIKEVFEKAIECTYKSKKRSSFFSSCFGCCCHKTAVKN
ncbi:small Rho-like GTP-binding protein [Hamiltosporidium tvaerminnensis]|uniref:Small Rho-like GTP-binding protein n=2 Tax=Hamiltosporidium TaxID=1176354 RepID=A0A4Q9LJH4_9MICR|nr:hypothetical protein LUQ84_001267 [Hamiltosporidium tvaerminnensis]TBU02701.1 small Rho-like GTP-binding protein [Hamiltosporidium tvaerminnensis]TBU06611.1 small Rho-like GTP-binding protein [Hamiltosporidium magnivora]TBU07431.1 small Rho-like GTP-binding protein [Hamiltosporidium magnivora]TBU20433.1 small Rho-like GTP-binding protein [Hamiltosporidium tvaerminnensis]